MCVFLGKFHNFILRQLILFKCNVIYYLLLSHFLPESQHFASSKVAPKTVSRIAEVCFHGWAVPSSSAGGFAVKGLCKEVSGKHGSGLLRLPE